jgi:superfamily II DNA or RNA helicase
VKKLTPKKHQIEAIKAIVNGLKESDRGHVVMACGTGKTLTALWAKEKINPKKTLVLVPTLGLLHQFFNNWQDNSSIKFEWLCVCSDESVTGDYAYASPSQLGIPVTNKITDIASFLSGESDGIIFSTYNSASLVGQAQKVLGAETIDLLIADEAHRTAGNLANKGFSDCLSDDKIQATKRLFFTATPKVYTEAVKTEKEKQGVNIASMDDENIYGKRLFTLSFEQAINQGLLTDYRVVISIIDEPNVLKAIEDNQLVSKLESETLAAHIAISKTIIERGSKRIITFHSRVKSAFDFAARHPSIHRLVSPSTPISCLGIHGKMNAQERSDILDKLRDSKDDTCIISNARCLSEGIDVPALDAIVFIDPKGSIIDVAQAVGRAIRLSPGKEYGYIIIPVFIEEKEDPIEALESSRFNVVWRTLNALRSHDEELSQELDRLREERGRRSSSPINYKFSKINIDLSQCLLASSFAEALATKVITNTTQKWYEQYGELCNHVERHGKLYTKDHPNYRFIDIQRMSYKNGKMPAERIRLLEEVDGWSWNTIDSRWEIAYGILSDQISLNGSNSMIPETIMPDGRRLDAWVSNQMNNYRKGQLDSDRIRRLESLPGWRWSRNESRFDLMRERLIKHIRENGTASISYPPKNKETKELATWISGIRSRYKKGILEQEQIDALNEVDQWHWDKNHELFKQFVKELELCISVKGRMPKKRDDPGFNGFHNKRKLHKQGKLPEWQFKVLSKYAGFFDSH